MRGVELVIRGNNRSAIQALKEVADQSNRTGRQVQHDSATTQDSFRKMGESAGRMRGVIGGLAGAVGLGGLAIGIKDVVSAGIDWQKQQAQLQGALKNTGLLINGNQRAMTSVAEDLSKRGGFGAAENVAALTQFIGTTRSMAKSQRDLTLATDISRRTGKDFSTTVRAIMMLEAGRTTGLARLGVAVPKVTTAQDALRLAHLKGRDALLSLEAAGYRFTAAQKAQYALTQQVTPAMLAQAKAQDKLGSTAAAFRVLQGRFGGSTDAFSRTTAGQVSNLQNRWKTLQEQLGSALLPGINKLVKAISDAVGWLDKHRLVLKLLLGTTAGVVGVLTAHKIITEALRAKTIFLEGATKLLGISTGQAAGTTQALGGAAGTSAPQVSRLGWESMTAADKMKAVGSGLLGLASKIAAAYLALQVFHSAKASIDETKRRFRRGLYGRGGVTEGGVQDYLSGRTGGGAPGLLAHPASQFNNPINNAVNAILGIGPGNQGGGLLNGFGLFANGGVVKPRYFAGGGPIGTDTIPGWLTPGEGVVTTRGMSVLGARGLAMLNSGRTSSAPIVLSVTVPLKVNNREIARATTSGVVDLAARGPASLVGGSIVTGAPGLPA